MTTRFVVFTEIDGPQIAVNPELVRFVRPQPDGTTRIVFDAHDDRKDHGAVYVKEGLKEVLRVFGQM